MPKGGGYDVTGLAVKVTREGIEETSRDLKELARSADKAEQQVDQLGRESKQAGRDVGGIGTHAEKATAGLSGMLGVVAGLTAAYMGFKKLSDIMGAAVEAASAQERIFAGLDIALANTGVSYGALAGQLDSYFAMLQKTTIYGDTDSAEALRSLTVITGDYNNALKLLEPTLQFSAAMHIDMATAARLAGQAATGMTGTLSRYGIILSQTTKDQLAMADAAGKADIVAAMLNEKFAGSAQHELTTYGGALQQLGNYWGDLTEAAGDLIVKSEVMPVVFAEITDAIMWMIDAVNTVGDALAYMQSVGDFTDVARSVESLKQALSGFGADIDETNLKVIWAFLANFVAGEISERITNVARAINALDGALESIAARGPSVAAIAEGLAEGWGRSLQVIPDLVASHETLEERIARVNAEIQGTLSAIQQHVKNLEGMRSGTDKTSAAVDPFIDNLAQQRAEIERQQMPIERYEQVLKLLGTETSSVGDQTARLADAMIDFASGGVVEMTAAMIALLEEYAAFVEMTKDPALVEFPSPPPDATASWTKVFDDIEGSFSNMLGKGFVGELESFGDIWEEIWKDLAKSATGLLTDAFTDWLQGGRRDEQGRIVPGTGGFMQSLENLTTAQRVGIGIAGAGMVYQGAQTGGTAGILQGMAGGAMTGAMWGLPAGGIGAVPAAIIGAVVGGIIAALGRQSEDQPWTDIARVGPGAMWGEGLGISTRGQDMTAREDRLFSMAIGTLYRGIADQWRDMLRGFGDSELFNLLREAPEIIDESFRMTAAEVEAWLREDRLPTLFQRQYAVAIRSGLRSLDMTSDAINQLFSELRDMPGTERMDALTSVVSALRLFADAAVMDWEAVTVEAGKTPMDEWIDSLIEAGEQMELLTTGWDDMRLIDRAADLEQIGAIFGQVTASTISMLRQLEQIARGIDAMFGQTIEGFTTRGMGEEELWGYYEERYNYYNNLLRRTDDPNLIIEYTQQMLRILNLASGMLTDEQWLSPAGGTGMTWQEWFLSVTTTAQTAADDAVQAQIDRAQEQYEILWGQMQTTRGWFMELDTAVEEVIRPLDDLPPTLTDFRDALIRTTYQLYAGPNENAEKSWSMPRELRIIVEQEPAQVVVNVNGSLAQLSTMIETAVERRAVRTERTILNAIS